MEKKRGRKRRREERGGVGGEQPAEAGQQNLQNVKGELVSPTQEQQHVKVQQKGQTAARGDLGTMQTFLIDFQRLHREVNSGAKKKKEKVRLCQ